MAIQKRPLAGLDANLLVVLDAIVETASVAESAKQLGLSASAVSHALSRVRELVGDPILVRSGRRMVTTTRAREIAPALREGLGLVAMAVTKPGPFSPDRAERELRIGAIDFGTMHVVPALLEVLQREAPRVDVIVRPYGSHTMDELGSGELSLALALRRALPGLRQTMLVREPFASVLRRDHPALQGRMTMKRFAELPHVLVSAAPRRRGGVDDALEKHGLSRRVALVVPTFAAAALAVAESDMVLTGSHREALLAQSHLPIEVFDPPVAIPPFTLSMYWHDREHGDPFMAWLRARLVAITASRVSEAGSATRRRGS
jgi:DNA-binding transcriptional LysR family regulator